MFLTLSISAFLTVLPQSVFFVSKFHCKELFLFIKAKFQLAVKEYAEAVSRLTVKFKWREDILQFDRCSDGVRCF